MAKTQGKAFIEGGISLEDKILVDDGEIGDEDLVLLEIGKYSNFTFTSNAVHSSNSCVYCRDSFITPVICKECKKINYCSIKCKQADYSSHKKKCKRTIRKGFLSCFCRPSPQESDDEVVEAEALSVKSIPESPRQTPGKLADSIVGLQNLGNTCFMNSALQCLSHTALLTSYFLKSNYSKDINKSNPLGTKGKLATSYAEVLENLWNKNSGSLAP